MPQTQTEDDQRTIKRSYHNLKNLPKNLQNLTPLQQSIDQSKNPVNLLLNFDSLSRSGDINNLELSQNFINFTKSSQPQKSLNLNNLTLIINDEKNNQKDQFFSNCCTRLFTFMQSTQKQKFMNQNKENQFNGNLLNLQKEAQCSLKQKICDFPLKLCTKPQRSAKFLKKIEYRSKNRQKNLNQQQNIQKNAENQLLDYIEGSRRKRQQLLIQLEQMDLDHLQNLCPENIKYLTPQQKITKKSTPKIKVQSSRNSSNGQKIDNKFFRKLQIVNDRKSPKVIVKENLSQRHFSLSSVSKSKGTFAPKNLPIMQRQKTRATLFNSKRPDKPLKQKAAQLKKDNGQANKIEEKPTKVTSKSKICLRRTNFLEQMNEQQQKSSKKSPLRKLSKNKGVDKDFEDEKCDKKFIELMKRKKELEKELTNLNEDIILFNKKKKKNSKALK